jgi:hypothetical protein
MVMGTANTPLVELHDQSVFFGEVADGLLLAPAAGITRQHAVGLQMPLPDFQPVAGDEPFDEHHVQFGRLMRHREVAASMSAITRPVSNSGRNASLKATAFSAPCSRAPRLSRQNRCEPSGSAVQDGRRRLPGVAMNYGRIHRQCRALGDAPFPETLNMLDGLVGYLAPQRRYESRPDLSLPAEDAVALVRLVVVERFISTTD